MTTRSSDAQTYSANEPRAAPKTACPGLNLVTFRPTASTSPARSEPGRFAFGFTNPVMGSISQNPVMR